MREAQSILSSQLPALRRLGDLAFRMVAGVLTKSAGPQRLIHDSGFHRERITRMAAALNGTHLVTSSADGTVRLWEAASGRCVRVFYCRNSGSPKIFVSPTRPRMVTEGPWGGGRRIWDLADGQCLADLSDHNGTPVHCDDAFFYCKRNWTVHDFLDRKSPDSQGSEVIIYDIDTGKRVRSFRIEGSHINYLQVSPDGALVAVANKDHCLRIWDSQSGELLHRSLPQSIFCEIIGITPDSRLVVLRSAAGITVINTAGFHITFATPNSGGSYYRHNYVLRGFQLIEKERDLNAPRDTSKIRVIDVRTGATEQMGTFDGSLALWSLRAEDNLCLEFARGRVDVWNIRDHEVTASYPLKPETAFWYGREVVFLENKEVALDRQETIVRLIDPLSGKPTRMIPEGDPVRDILITPDGRSLLTLGASSVKHWDLTTGLCASEFGIPQMTFPDGLPGHMPRAALTPDGKRLVGLVEKGIAVYDLATGRQESEFPLPGPAGEEGKDRPQGPCALYVSEDGKRLMAVSGPSGFVGAYDLQTGIPVAGFPLEGLERFEAFCMSGNLLATAKGYVLYLRDGRTGRLLQECQMGGHVGDVVIAAAGQLIITVGAFDLLFLDRKTGGLVTKKPYDSLGASHDQFERWLTPVPDSGRFIVHSRDYIALWDADAQKSIWQEHICLKDKVIKAAVFPDGKRLATLDTAGVVEFRDVASGKVLADLHVLPGGFIWQTPPDDHAPAGWLWTDREDLISVTSRSEDNRKVSVFQRGASEHEAYLKIYNNRKMVMARIEGQAVYERQIKLYNHILDTSRIGSKAGGSRAALPAGEKGDRT